MKEAISELKGGSAERLADFCAEWLWEPSVPDAWGYTPRQLGTPRPSQPPSSANDRESQTSVADEERLQSRVASLDQQITEWKIELMKLKSTSNHSMHGTWKQSQDTIQREQLNTKIERAEQTKGTISSILSKMQEKE
ncbi:hypothetical protein L204_104756 [Cryptococcus depauperatus]